MHQKEPFAPEKTADASSPYQFRWTPWQNPLSKKLGVKKNPDRESWESDDEEEVSVSNLSHEVIELGGVIIPMSEMNASENHYNFWILETSFAISADVFDAIDLDTPGIEIFEMLTPYRARIAIARMFDENAVQKHLQSNVLAALRLQNESDRELYESNSERNSGKVYDILARSGKPYAILLIKGPQDKDFDVGERTVIFAENDSEFMDKLLKLNDEHGTENIRVLEAHPARR